MELNLEKFNIRKSTPWIAGTYSLPENVERYIVKGQGLIGVDIFKDDKITIVNIEGSQGCETAVFNKEGKNKQTIIGQKNNGDAKFIKYILNNSSDKKVLLRSLKRKNIDFYKSKSSDFFDLVMVAACHLVKWRLRPFRKYFV